MRWSLNSEASSSWMRFNSRMCNLGNGCWDTPQGKCHLFSWSSCFSCVWISVSSFFSAWSRYLQISSSSTSSSSRSSFSFLAFANNSVTSCDSLCKPVPYKPFFLRISFLLFSKLSFFPAIRCYGSSKGNFDHSNYQFCFQLCVCFTVLPNFFNSSIFPVEMSNTLNAVSCSDHSKLMFPKRPAARRPFFVALRSSYYGIGPSTNRKVL